MASVVTEETVPTAEERAAMKKKPQQQEKHYDDCGSDTGPIKETHQRAMLAHGLGSLGDAVAYSFFDDECRRFLLF